ESLPSASCSLRTPPSRPRGWPRSRASACALRSRITLAGFRGSLEAFHAIRRTWLRRQRARLFERHIAVIVAWARESSALGDDRSIDVCAVGCGAIADFTAMGLLAGQAAGQPPSDEPGHRAPRILAARCPQFSRIDALEAYCRARDDDG